MTSRLKMCGALIIVAGVFISSAVRECIENNWVLGGYDIVRWVGALLLIPTAAVLMRLKCNPLISEKWICAILFATAILVAGVSFALLRGP